MTRSIRIRSRHAAALLVAIVAIAAALVSTSVGSSLPTAASPGDRSRHEHRGALGEAGGALPEGTTVFDDEVPGDAVDPGPADATSWLSTHGAAYSDPTRDPRMQR